MNINVKIYSILYEYLAILKIILKNNLYSGWKIFKFSSMLLDCE